MDDCMLTCITCGLLTTSRNHALLHDGLQNLLCRRYVHIFHFHPYQPSVLCSKSAASLAQQVPLQTRGSFPTPTPGLEQSIQAGTSAKPPERNSSRIYARLDPCGEHCWRSTPRLMQVQWAKAPQMQTITEYTFFTPGSRAISRFLRRRCFHGFLEHFSFLKHGRGQKMCSNSRAPSKRMMSIPYATIVSCEKEKSSSRRY